MTKFNKLYDGLLNIIESYSQGQKSLISESKFSRIANILRGNVPKIQTIAFLTAENPNGKPASKEFNIEKNKELVKMLKSANLGFHHVLGKYGGEENSFMVNNITKDEALDLGAKFNQHSIIFGERVTSGDYFGMKFQLIGTDEDNYNQIMGQQEVFININDAEDYYSEVRGRKFQIPFYDDNYNDAQWGKDNLGKIDKKIVEQINHLTDKVLEERTGSYRWTNRGHIKNLIKSLNQK